MEYGQLDVDIFRCCIWNDRAHHVRSVWCSTVCIESALCHVGMDLFCQATVNSC